MLIAIKGQNSLMARCDWRCYELHRPGKAEERDHVGMRRWRRLGSWRASGHRRARNRSGCMIRVIGASTRRSGAWVQGGSW